MGIQFGLSNARHAHLERNFSVVRSTAHPVRFSSALETVLVAET